MDSDILLNQDELFDKHFKDALTIRAICDDMLFPGAYSPIFVNIHIRGINHFRNPPLSKEQYKIVFQFLNPENQENIKKRLHDSDDSEMKDQIEDMCVGDSLKGMDEYLNFSENIQSYFSTQLENLKRMYFDEVYREHMITLYTFFIKSRIAEYDEKRIEAAFRKGRIRDKIQEIKEQKEDTDLNQDKKSA